MPLQFVVVSKQESLDTPGPTPVTDMCFSPESENQQRNGDVRAMSWHKITLPIPPMKEIDPKVVEIGDLARDCWERENHPAGFGMLHATRGSNPLEHDTRVVYPFTGRVRNVW